MTPIHSWLDAEEVRRMAEGLMAPVCQQDEVSSEAGYDEGFEGFIAADEDQLKEHRALMLKSEQEGLKQQEDSDFPDRSAEEESLANAPGLVSAAKTSVVDLLAGARRMAEGSGMLPGSSKDVSIRPESEEGDVILPDSEASSGRGSILERVSNPSSEGEKEVISSESKAPPLSELDKFGRSLRERTGVKSILLIDEEGSILLDQGANPKLVPMMKTWMKRSDTSKIQSTGAKELSNFHIKVGSNEILEVILCEGQRGRFILGIVSLTLMGEELVRQVADDLVAAVESKSED